MSQLHCVLQLRVALVCVFLWRFATQGCVFLLCFAIQGCAGLRILIVFCNSGLRWSAYSYCDLQLRVALVRVFLFCFAIQGCAGLRILIVFCNSGLRWSACSYCVLRLLVETDAPKSSNKTPKRSETGLKPFETVGKQLYLLILHLHRN